MFTMNKLMLNCSLSGCPSLPPLPNHLCTAPSGSQNCHYDDSNGGTEDVPMLVNCCCNRCDLDMTCSVESSTGLGLWQPAYPQLCPAEGCGREGGTQLLSMLKF